MVAEDHVTFAPGALARLAARAHKTGKALDEGTSNKGLVFPGEFPGTNIWACFALLQGAVRHVGEFDTNFWPSGHEGYDYLARLSRMGLWVKNLTDIEVRGVMGGSGRVVWEKGRRAVEGVWAAVKVVVLRSG